MEPARTRLLTRARSPNLPPFHTDSTTDSAEIKSKLKPILGSLPETSRLVLLFLIHFLQRIAQSHEINKMTAANLGVVFGPNLFRPLVQTQFSLMDSTSAKVVELLIEDCDDIIGTL